MIQIDMDMPKSCIVCPFIGHYPDDRDIPICYPIGRPVDDTRVNFRPDWCPLKEAQPEQRWISISERPPKQGQEVICQCRANIIKVLKLDANGDWYEDARHCYMGGFVVAWMPKPKPIKETRNE